jgi:hypothetical protein
VGRGNVRDDGDADVDVRRSGVGGGLGEGWGEVVVKVSPTCDGIVNVGGGWRASVVP